MNEQQVGEGVRSSGISREEIFVTSKLWISDYGYEQTFHAFDRSLRKLGLDFLDLYLIHWPVPSAFEATVDSYKAAIKLLAEGCVRAIGVCNFRANDLDKLIELRKADKTHGIITQAWSPIGGVKRYGAKASKEGAQDSLSHPTVVLLAKKYRKTAAQIILRWQIELGTSLIPKSVRSERIAENIDIFDFAPTSEEVRAINALDTGERGGPDPEQVNPQTFSITIQD